MTSDSQIDNLIDGLNTIANIVAEETVNLKQNMEGRMLSLEDKIDKIWNVVMKGGDAHKVLSMSDSVKAISPMTTVKKRQDNAYVDVIAASGKLMDVDYAVDRGVAKGYVLSSEVKTGGSGVSTRNTMKNQAWASGIEVSDIVDKGQKLAASEI